MSEPAVLTEPELSYGNPLLLSIEEARALLGVSRYFILKMIQNGDLPVARYETKTWVRRDGIEVLLERMRKG